MALDILKEVDILSGLTVGELHQKYREVFGESPRSRHKGFLIKRIAWRMQSIAEGGLSDRAIKRAHELANVADARIRAPSDFASSELVMTKKFPRKEKHHLSAGTVLLREYRGVEHHVKVLESGFEYQGETYRSLSGVAGVITGTNWNGHVFFGLKTKGKCK